MKILVVGSGGREHALVWKLAQGRVKHEIYCAPGNAGTGRIATNLPIGSEAITDLLKWAQENKPDLTVVGPEAPLCLGIADEFAEHGLRVFGPRKDAARLEGSKAFAKEVMVAAGVPTAQTRTFNDATDAVAYAESLTGGCVVKADGLAAGKGVIVCADPEESVAAIELAMVGRAFGEAGSTVLVEELLTGEEASILALVDGERVVMLASSQDHKRVFDGDKGPNTGGMGAYSPAPVVTDELRTVIMEQVFKRTLAELRKRGIAYRGVLYAGIMVTDNGPKVLEFNCRFGDPETQAVLARLDSDLAEALAATADGRLTSDMVQWKPDAAVCVVMASGGYPGSYEKGLPIDGLTDAEQIEGTVVFHAGTKLAGDRTVTSGGRVLGVTSIGPTLRQAVERAYRAVDAIRFEDAQCRRDIAQKALNPRQSTGAAGGR